MTCVTPPNEVDEHRVDTLIDAPASNRIRHEFRPVVEPDKRWRPASFDREPGQCPNDAVGVNGVIDHDRQRFAGVLVPDVHLLEDKVDHFRRLDRTTKLVRPR